MRIVVIDGQSGRLGSQLVEGLLAAGLAENNEIRAVGTNVLATSSMLKAGAACGATGENPVVVACREADVITGPIGIVIADALLGEITPVMAAAVGQSRACKVLLPVNRCRNLIVGLTALSRTQLVEAAVSQIASLCRENASESRC